MSGTTRFPARASGPAERVAGFVAHLRLNGMRVGPQETEDALAALSAVEAQDPEEARRALKTVLVADAEGWAAFDALFDAYWRDGGRVRTRQPSAHRREESAPPALWRAHLDPSAEEDGGAGTETAGADDGDGAAEEAEGRRLASRREAPGSRDLRRVMDPDTLREAESAAERLARAIRDRRSRRRRADRRGAEVDLRRTLRASLARGGEPIELRRRRRPDRPVRLVALCDVSGSMQVHSRVFLAFLKGLVDADTRADAWAFHLRPMRVTDALRDRDSLRAATRLSLMAEGFGGGTDIAGCLERFAAGQGARRLGSRTVLLILSDGYCTSQPARLAAALARLRRKVGRIVWLDPNAASGEPARHVAAALPHLDAHLPANTVEALAALEPEFARL